MLELCITPEEEIDMPEELVCSECGHDLIIENTGFDHTPAWTTYCPLDC